jgi:type III pantothenate kinase
LKPLYSEVNSYKLPIILTGGDAKKLARVFKDASVDELLIFKGMQKIIKETKDKLDKMSKKYKG